VEDLTPRQTVNELDKYIIGQEQAKKAVAIALRNRYRRRLLEDELRDEILPKNILMIGPTGVGKTEIARRLARLVKAPFIKVEVSKFTEVGYVGRDVESMIRDLLETAIQMEKQEKIREVEDKAEELAEERLMDYLMPGRKKSSNPLNMFLSSSGREEEGNGEDNEARERMKSRRERLLEKLRSGELEEHPIEIEVEASHSPMLEIFSGAGVEEMGINMQDLFGGMFPRKKKKRRVNIGQAREILKQQEAQKLIDMDEVTETARERVQESGIIFLDEIDKITGKDESHGPDVSREGVQRDILPVVEGSTVMTKHGPVNTDHILFIAAGAFHMAKPSDLIPELQGRFPIRVELSSLSEANFREILTEPQNALIKQYVALLQAEEVEIEFSDEGIAQLARIAFLANEQMENIGARRLHTVLEKLLEEISFAGPELKGQKIIIDDDFVKDQLEGIIKDKDLSRYIL